MKKLILLFSVPALFLAGCSKDENGVTLDCLPARIVFNNTDTVDIIRNDQNKLIKYGKLTANHYTFSYSGLTATMQFGSDLTTLFLNAAGNVVSFNDTTTSGPTTFYYAYNFQYDSDNRLVKSLQQVTDNAIGLNNESYIDSLVYENGNLIEKYTFYKAPLASTFSLQERVEIDYSDTRNKLGHYYLTNSEEAISILSGWLHLYHLLGRASRDLPAVTRVYNGSGTLIRQLNYTFLLDTDGFPTEVNIVRSVGGSSTENRKFIYTCE
jgi:hypothetical protein